MNSTTTLSNPAMVDSMTLKTCLYHFCYYQNISLDFHHSLSYHKVFVNPLLIQSLPQLLLYRLGFFIFCYCIWCRYTSIVKTWREEHDWFYCIRWCSIVYCYIGTNTCDLQMLWLIFEAISVWHYKGRFYLVVCQDRLNDILGGVYSEVCVIGLHFWLFIWKAATLLWYGIAYLR